MNQPNHWTNDRLTDRPTNRLTNRPTNQPTNQLTNRNLLQQLVLPHILKKSLALYINGFCTIRLLVSYTHKLQCNITFRYETLPMLKKNGDRRICKSSSYLHLCEWAGWQLYKGNHVACWQLEKGKHVAWWQLYKGNYVAWWQLEKGKHVAWWQLEKGKHVAWWKVYKG
jgi:hypothetical protein